MSANTGGPASEKTLLDWYAGQALVAIPHIGCGSDLGPEQIAHDAYNIATAMLAEKARREAVVQQSSTTDHSPDATKMIELQAANRELVEALADLVELIEVDLLEQGFESSPSAQSSLEHSKAILSKHKGAA